MKKFSQKDGCGFLYNSQPFINQVIMKIIIPDKADAGNIFFMDAVYF